MVETAGKHLLVELLGCSAERLDNVSFIRGVFEQAALAANACIVQTVFHRFAPTGVSGVCVVEESHLSIHTWPEENYAAVDIYTCGTATYPYKAVDFIRMSLNAEKILVLDVSRGKDGMSVGTVVTL